MKTTTTAAIFFLGMMSTSLQALDLTPHELVLSNDGPPMKRYFFEDEGKRLSFRIDSKMATSGSGDSVGFRFDDVTTATMRVSRSQMSPALAFNEKNIASYRTAARSFLGVEATDVQVEEEKPNAISINTWTSHQFVFTYTLFGRPHRRSITFLNYSEKEQFVVDVAASADDYDKTYARGYRVLNSLSDLPAEETGPS